MATLLWVAAIGLIVLGVVGTVLPALPGPILIFGGVALAAWIDHFTRIPGWVVAVVGALTALAGIVDYAAAAMGAKRAGASRLAIVGAGIGTLAGVLSGVWGLLFMPLVGAAVGQFISQRDLLRAGKVGVATWIGLLVGAAVKLAIAFTMVAIFLIAIVV